MFTKIFSATIYGINAKLITVEIDISRGLLQWNIVGLPDTAVKESRQRIASAIKNSGIIFPDKKITVNLSPADIKKEGSLFDMPIALGLLDAAGIITIPSYLKEEALFVGEIGLDGSFVNSKGVFIIAADAIKLGKKYIVIPKECAAEASLIKDIKIIAISNLQELITKINNDKIDFYYEISEQKENENIDKINLSEISGNDQAKRALQIAAAGNHAILLIGSPGSGKTMLAERLITLLPKMTESEKIELTKLYSSNEKLKNKSLINRRPFQSPHHTISTAGMIGGGSNPTIGAISLAHNGVLFLDELLEYKRSCLEALRQPLESKNITISRINGELTFPANFLLVAATNPCPCGYYGDKRVECSCSQHAIKNYLKKLSGPLIDRIDMHIGVYGNDKIDFILDKSKNISSEDLIKKIEIARKMQKERFKSEELTNGIINGPKTLEICNLSEEAKNAIDKAYESLSLTMRGYFKIIKIARTIADLDESSKIKIQHIVEAISYRIIDKFL